MYTRLLVESIQQLVPVNPVWPKASGGKLGPAVEAFVAASCQANERASFNPSVMFSRKSSHVSFESSSDTPPMNWFAKRKVSRAVENKPAWPAAPPRKCAFPSWTSPQMLPVRQLEYAGSAGSSSHM